MRQHISFLMLLCRSTMGKILLLLGAMCAVETGLVLVFGLQMPGIEQMVVASKLTWVFGAALIGMTLIFYTLLGDSGVKLDYTLRRLGVSQKAQFIWHAIYAGMCYVLLLGVQLLLAFGLCHLWMAQRGTVSNQALFLAFYRNTFLHSLLPQEEWSLTVRNLFFVICMGIAAACVPVCRRRGKVPFGLALLAGGMELTFAKRVGEGSSDVLMVVLAIGAAFSALVQAWGDDYEEED